MDPLKWFVVYACVLAVLFMGWLIYKMRKVR